MSNKQCLIVESSELVRRLTKVMLTALSIDTREAVDATAAIMACSAAMPDTIILDGSIPPHNGFDCLLALRRLSGGERPAILYSTIEHDPVELQRWRDAGADGVLVKPYDRATLRQTLADVGVI